MEQSKKIERLEKILKSDKSDASLKESIKRKIKALKGEKEILK